MTAPHDPIAVTVVGDVIVDRHFYHSDNAVIEVAGLGGAAGLARLIEETAKAAMEVAKAAGILIKDPDRPPIAVCLGITTPAPSEFPPRGNAFAVWAPYKRSAEKGASSVWRAARPMGYGSPEETAPPEFRLTPAGCTSPRVLVLDDGGFDFRERANEALWCLPTKGETKPDWIILKMSRPVGHGDLWRELTDKFADRLVCVVSANELRDECVVLEKGASWEAAIEDVGAALASNPVLKALAGCRHLVVNFSIDGALWIDQMDARAPKATLIFDPERGEGEWGETRQGAVFGYLTCMAAAVAHAAAAQVSTGKGLDLGSAIRGGLSAMRDLLENGHGVVGPRERPSGYPFARLGGVIAEAKGSSRWRRSFGRVPTSRKVPG